MKCKICLDGRLFKPERKEYVRFGKILKSYDSDFAVWHCQACEKGFKVPRKGKIVYSSVWAKEGKKESD